MSSVDAPSKKRKHHDSDHPSKRAKIQHSSEEHGQVPVKQNSKSKDKRRHKAKITHGELDEAFTRVRAVMTVSVPPVFASNPSRGVNEMLDSLVMKYFPALEGVMISHSNLAFSTSAGVLIAESPFTTARVSFDALVWRPRIGMRLRGSVSLCGPDHVGLILQRTFNCSIPRWGLDESVWEFVEGPRDGEDELIFVDGGWWRTREGGEELGGPSRRLDFTVVGLTIANQMLSLTGSLQDDPLNPANLPTEDSQTEKTVSRRPVGVVESDFEDPTEPMVGSMLANYDIPQDVDMDSADEGDPFDSLANLAKERQEAIREAPAEGKNGKKTKKSEKRKRKAEEVQIADSKPEQVDGEVKKKKKKRKAEDGASIQEEPKKKKRKKPEVEAGEA